MTPKGTKPPPRRFTKRVLDSWFPTVVRYLGLLLFGYAVLIDQGQTPALIPAATALVFFKNVVGNGHGDK